METLIDVFGNEITIKKEVQDKLKDLQKQKKELDKKLKDLSNAIVEEIKTYSSEGTRVGDFNFVVKGNTYGLEFDLEGFKNDNPELYIEYLVPTYTKPSYSIVSATRVKKED